MKTKKIVTWVLSFYISAFFLQTLFYKFTGAEITKLIFVSTGTWMISIGLPQRFGQFFIDHGGIFIGVFELIAAILLLIPKTRIFGSLLALGVISGAVFFHLFTPLGIAVKLPDGRADFMLFIHAVLIWLSSVALICLGKQSLSAIVKTITSRLKCSKSKANASH